MYKLYEGLLQAREENQEEDFLLESIREQLLTDAELLEIEDFGAGSRKLKRKFRTAAEVTKYSSSSRKFNKLYRFFCQMTPARHVLELGTCTGVNAHYLSTIGSAQVYTLEGSEALWEKAQAYHQRSNIHFLLGDIRKTLPLLLKELASIDFALMDATHTKTASLQYFELLLPYLHEQSILAIGDIHWSREMEEAWDAIKSHPRVHLSFDFFECGIVFFDPSFTREAYILDY
ncbi:O-methyltransferase [Mongoliitalea daihaiensis]|uniref:O-methyltransferase n=1 Tax=Mongoliitalea daihaiensis TaxID=2782006 RepID=UPI001F1A9297|nr:class I SAM-dependent methyltransferase [Mongoliitalea daihaiensis]